MRIFWATTLLLLTSIVQAAPEADLWPLWNASEEASTVRIDHSAFSQFLANYTKTDKDQNRLVRYGQVSDEDKKALETYIASLIKHDPRRLSRNEQFAYWVNLYNALTIQLILKHYPVASITKLGGFFSFGPWDDEIVSINGEDLTLNDIEHRILRPIWQDKRIHYVVNCASIGCPNIGASALSADNIDKQLDNAAEQFINASKGMRIEKGKLVLSTIYKWYAEDFGDRQQLMRHLLDFFQGDAAIIEQLQMPDAKISYNYDWRLNDVIK